MNPNLDYLFVKNNIEIANKNHHHTRAGWINLDCPFCSPGSKRYRLGFRIAQKYFNCWACGPLNTNKTLSELFGSDAKAFLEEIGDVELYKEDKIVGRYKEPVGILPTMPKQYYEYLRQRFGKETSINIERYKLQAIGPLGRHLALRIFVPVYYKSKKASWTTRSIDPGCQVRYRNAPASDESLSIKSLLFGEDFVRHSILVVEGPFSAMRIGPGAVSTGGVNYTRSQVLKLSRYPYRYICFDSDKPGKLAAERLAAELAVYPGETQIITLDAKDPGECRLKELRKLRELIE